MVRAIAIRVAGGVVLVLTLTFIAYLIFATIPLSASGLGVPEQSTDEARRQLGLDQPIIDQWGSFVWDLSTAGSLGSELSVGDAGRPVNSVLAQALPATLSLAIGGFAIALLVSIPLGMLTALRHRTFTDRAVMLFTVVGVVLHPFVIGLLLKGFVATRWGLAPEELYCPLTESRDTFSSSGGATPCGGLLDWAEHLWLPWLTFAFFFMPIYTRLVRARVLENLSQPYVQTARAKGASEARIITRHVARNALGPLSATIALDIGTVVVAAIYIETIFGLNGIGLLVATNLSGASGYDRNVLIGVVVITALAITLANVLSDLVLRVSDPRIRVGPNA